MSQQPVTECDAVQPVAVHSEVADAVQPVAVHSEVADAVDADAVDADAVDADAVEAMEADEQRSYMSKFDNLQREAQVEAHRIGFDNLQREAQVEAYRIGVLQYAMESCFFPSIFGFEAFMVEKHLFDETFIREEVIKKMSSQEKEKYKTVFKQTHVLEILGSCGYMSSILKQNGKKYRLFHWSGFFAAKWAYRFATNLDKSKKITVLTKQKDTTPYRKIRCPNVLYQLLIKNFETQRVSDLEKSFIKQEGLCFMSENDLINKMKEPRYFFPFKNLVYDDQIVKNLFRMYDDDADTDEHVNWQSLDLHLTHKAQVNITLLYTWIKNSFETGILEIGRLR